MTDPFNKQQQPPPRFAGSFPPPPGAHVFSKTAGTSPQHHQQQQQQQTPSSSPPRQEQQQQPPPQTDFAAASHAPPPQQTAATPPPIDNDNDDAGEPEWSGNVEFFPRSPIYNDRVIPLALVSLVPLIPAFGNFPVAVVAVVGAASTYIADLMNFRRTTIALLLTTLVAIWIGFYLGNVVEVWNSVAAFVVLLNASLFMCLLAVWALIHVRWIVLKFPELSVRLERVVLGLLPFAALPSLVSTCAALAGSRHAAFLLSMTMCALHALFYWRRASSFAVLTGGDDATGSNVKKAGSAAASSSSSAEEQPTNAQELRDICFVVQKPETFIFSLLTLVLPSVLHGCFVWPTVNKVMLNATAVAYGRWLLVVNIAGLVAVPCIYFLLFHNRALWFLRHSSRFSQSFYHGFLEKHHSKLIIAAYELGLVFVIARVMHSRYAFFFAGFVPPLNFLMLLLIGSAVPVLVMMSWELYNIVDANKEKENSKNSKQLWGGCLALSLIMSIAFTMTLGMPPFFVATTALAVAALWAYLVDRKRNAGQYTMFIFMSAIALLWWMFQSFSFIIADLKVFGAEGIVPAPLVAGSMLWVYVFGCWLIPLSFQKEAKVLFTFVLVFHSQKVLWIERVLYTQNELNTYPIQYVLLTTVVGAFTAWRLFVNNVLSAGPTAIVVGAYVSKVLVYASDSVEIDYRWSDGTTVESILRETAVAYASWGIFATALYAQFGAIPESLQLHFGIGGAKSDKEKDAVGIKRRVHFCAASLATNMYVFFTAATPTLVRWFIQDVVRVPSPSRLQLLGSSLIFATLGAWYSFWALYSTFPAPAPVAAAAAPQQTGNDDDGDESDDTTATQATTTAAEQAMVGASPVPPARYHRFFASIAILVFAITLLDPPVEAAAYLISIGEANTHYRQEFDDTQNGGRPRPHLLLPDLPFAAPWWSRWVLFFALCVAITIRGMLSVVVPPLGVRAVLWSVLGVLLGLSVTGCSIIIADVKIYAIMSTYFILTLLCFDLAHYSKLDGEMCITLFIVALISFVVGVFLLNHVDIFSVTRIEAYLIDGVFASRVGAIGVLAATSFTLAGMLKCRLSGFSLMPRSMKIDSIDAISQLSLVLTSACALGAVALILLSLLLGAGSTPLLLLAGGMLLLVDDRGWGFGLERGMRRYVLPFIVISFCLWLKSVQELLAARSLGAKANLLPYAVAMAMCVPSQLVVTFVLWRGGSADPNTTRAAAQTARGVFALVLLFVDLLVVGFTVSTNLRLIAALNLIGHVTRLSLFEGIITKTKEAIL